jgi:DNA-binding protein H-NS
MDKDFKKLNAKREINKVEKELKQIFENSTKDNSTEEESNKSKKTKGIKRPKNVKYILYKDFELDFDY